MQRAEANNYYPHLMASKLAVDGSSAATTTLDFIAGATLATHTPIFAIITYSSGTLAPCVVKIRADSVDLSAAAVALTTLDATTAKLIVSLTGSVSAFTNDPGGVMNVVVGIPSTASEFNIYIYGIELN